MLSRVGLLAIALVVCSGASAIEVTGPPQCKNCFSGEPKLKPNPADASGATKILEEDFYFVDGAGLVWKAGAGDISDGASIPELFQPIIGGPWEKSYVPAAVMHDHYTKDAHKVRTWQATARMFYAGMIVKNVEIVRAKVMYYAVYVFGPHWDRLRPGTDCGHDCVYSTILQLNLQPSQYDQHVDEKKAELDYLQLKIADREIGGRPLSLNDLEEEARRNHPTHVFFLNDNTR